MVQLSAKVVEISIYDVEVDEDEKEIEDGTREDELVFFYKVYEWP